MQEMVVQVWILCAKEIKRLSTMKFVQFKDMHET